MKTLAATVAIAATMTLGAVAADAAVITINSTTPSWSNVVGGSLVAFRTTGTGNNTVTEVRWGNPPGSANSNDDKSGLGFNPANPPVANITTDTTFLLGTLTHFNQPIGDNTAADSVVLNLATAIAGAIPVLQTFQYRFSIDETTNQAPCAYPSTTPCADRITFTNLDTTNAFTVGGQPYTIELLGFSSDGGTTIRRFFDSQENGNNNIGLFARITAPFTPVPEPMSLALFGAALAGLGLARRRSA